MIVANPICGKRLPQMSNPAAASDVVSGKQFILPDGSIGVGTRSNGTLRIVSGEVYFSSSTTSADTKSVHTGFRPKYVWLYRSTKAGSSGYHQCMIFWQHNSSVNRGYIIKATKQYLAYNYDYIWGSGPDPLTITATGFVLNAGSRSEVDSNNSFLYFLFSEGYGGSVQYIAFGE